MKRFVIVFFVCLLTSYAYAQRIVDLGLSVKWTDRNNGAQYESDPGSFFAWGECREKHSYNEENYLFGRESLERLTKYCTMRSNGYHYFKDDKDTLEAEDDVAAQQLGFGFRIPSRYDWEELISKCEWKYVRYNSNIVGARVIGPNGNSIFLPCDGTLTGDWRSGVENWGYYWCREVNRDDCKRAYRCLISLVDAMERGAFVQDKEFRSRGLHVRAVYTR